MTTVQMRDLYQVSHGNTMMPNTEGRSCLSRVCPFLEMCHMAVLCGEGQSHY